MTETEKAYIAGIIDGEGSICISQGRQQSTPSLIITVAMTPPIVPTLLHKHFAGTLIKVRQKRSTLGYIWRWMVTGHKCKQVLEAIQPYVLLKERQILVALAFNKTLKPKDRGIALTTREILVKERLQTMMQDLNDLVKQSKLW